MALGLDLRHVMMEIQQLEKDEILIELSRQVGLVQVVLLLQLILVVEYEVMVFLSPQVKHVMMVILVITMVVVVYVSLNLVIIVSQLLQILLILPVIQSVETGIGLALRLVMMPTHQMETDVTLHEI